MTNDTKRPYALQQLLTCQRCQSPMLIKSGPLPEEDIYRCSRSRTTPESTCAAPDIRARQLESWIIQDLSEVVLSPRNVQLMGHYLAQLECSPEDPAFRGLVETASDPLTYTTADAAPAAQRLFASFIETIAVDGIQATIHYSVPLPQDGPLPGATTQTIDLPARVLG